MDTLKSLTDRTVEFMEFLSDLIDSESIDVAVHDIEEVVPSLLSVVISLCDLTVNNTDSASPEWIWNDVNLSLNLLSGICRHSPLKTIPALTHWNRWCHFIKFLVFTAEKEPKFWMISDRLLSSMRGLIDTDCDSLSRIVLRHKLLFYFKDILYCLLTKSAEKCTPKVHRFMFNIVHRVCSS